SALSSRTQQSLRLGSRASIVPRGGVPLKDPGEVVLAGTIGRDGRVGAVLPTGGRDRAFVRNGIANLTIWWSEPAPRVDSFQVTYSFVPDSALRAGQNEVQSELPSKITVRASP